jgi:metal-sulfur cluster biosynthetic enzyme
MITEEQVREVLKNVLDPEIGISVIDLNMIKTVAITDKEIQIEMVLTMPGCPMAAYMMENVKAEVETIAEGRSVNVRKLDEKWIPPWESEQAKVD